MTQMKKIKHSLSSTVLNLPDDAVNEDETKEAESYEKAASCDDL